MKKRIVVLLIAVVVIVAISLISTAPASAQRIWEGNGEGYGETFSNTELNSWNSGSHGCGWCGSYSQRGMASKQVGEVGFRLEGYEKNVDRVRFTGDMKYESGYNQFQRTPYGGYQESWGSQSGRVEGLVDSHR